MQMTQLEANMFRQDVLTQAKIVRPFCSLEKIFAKLRFYTI